jgi:alpha-L-fucosidase
MFNAPANTTTRTSLNYGPKRDILQELFAAASTYYPNIHRGTYFSLPEWYHPDYARYGFSLWPGGPPKNPYTGAVIPYTGYVKINDFVKDVQYPQMRALAYDYNTELMWCDIGGANNSPQMIADWFNWARSNGRQVTFNSRCGLPGDFDTPE